MGLLDCWKRGERFSVRSTSNFMDRQENVYGRKRNLLISIPTFKNNETNGCYAFTRLSSIRMMNDRQMGQSIGRDGASGDSVDRHRCRNFTMLIASLLRVRGSRKCRDRTRKEKATKKINEEILSSSSLTTAVHPPVESVESKLICSNRVDSQGDLPVE